MNEERIFELLSELKAHAGVTNERLNTYNGQLKEHMRRSDALETKVDELYKWKYYVMGAVGIFIFLSQMLVKYL